MVKEVKWIPCLAIIGLILLNFEGSLGGDFNNAMVVKEEGTVVNIKCGEVQGRRDTLVLPGIKVDSFLGIPYAQPPVGDLRFKRPESAKAWKEIRDATEVSNSCPQILDTTETGKLWSPDKISEDCLYLNVFLPSELKADDKLAVMVWIHGGGFKIGSSSLDLYDGRFLAAESGTIVVSMNYRLGALGFFSLDTESTPENVGLYDQLEALKWIQANIAFFGGNRKRVTIFGESSGAVSVSLHLLSEASRGKFNRAILQSGAALNPWAVIPLEEARRRSKDLAKKLGCEQNTEEKIVECMRGVDIDNIVQKQESVVQAFLQFPFVPTIDGTFLKDTPANLLAKGKFKARSILAGSNKDEGTLFLAFLLKLDPTNPQMNKKEFLTYLNTAFYFFPQFPTPLSQQGMGGVMQQYSPIESLQDNLMANMDALNRAVTDSSFICPMNQFISEYAKTGENVFSYIFTQPIQSTLFPPSLGVTHGSELFFTFSHASKYGTRGKILSESDIAFSKQLIKLWSNFAKSRNPNAKDSSVSYPNWPKYTRDKPEHLELNAKYVGEETGATVKASPDGKCTFWRDNFDQFSQQKKIPKCG